MEQIADAVLLLRVSDCEDGELANVDDSRAQALAADGLLMASMGSPQQWSLTEAGARWLDDFATGAHRDARRLAAFLDRYREARLTAVR